MKLKRLFQPTDNASLVVFRICFGLLMALEAYRYLSLGLARVEWVEPAYHFTYPGFHWVGVWPGEGIYLHFYTLMLLGLLIAAGFFYRLSAALFCLGFTYVFLLDRTSYLNHFYLICLLSFLMIFLPAHRSLSVDARLRPALRSDTAPAWGLWLLRAQLGFVYFFGGVAKLNADWLQGWPMRSWLPGAMPLPWLGELWNREWFAVFMSWGGLLLDLCIVPALLYRRTRVAAFALVVAFHLVNSQMFHIGIFPWLAIAATAIFFDPDWPRRIFNWPRVDPVPEAEEPFHWNRSRRVVAGLVGAYLAVQVLLPLRHHLYPGPVAWTEEGHMFSWRMKLRDKRGVVMFRLTDRETGKTWMVDPNQTLAPQQIRRVTGLPDMLRQYARHLADAATQEGSRRVKVQALTAISLNGRPPLPLIDPTVDLAAEPPRILRSAPWLLPLEGNRFESDPNWQAINEGLVNLFPRDAEPSLE